MIIGLIKKFLKFIKKNNKTFSCCPCAYLSKPLFQLYFQLNSEAFVSTLTIYTQLQLSFIKVKAALNSCFL